MKQLLCVLVAVSLTAVASGRDTAYKALRAVGAKQGEAILNRVTLVEGLKGAPEPRTWRVVIDDPDTRGGVREFEVTGDRVAAERAPVGYAGGGAPEMMDFSRLNLDSSGAFTIANEEAARREVGFDSVDYTLAPDAKGRPVWTVRLLDENQLNVGTVLIAADDGSVLRIHGLDREAGEETRRSDARYLREHGLGEEGEGGGLLGKFERFGFKVKKHVYQAGGHLERFFTGERTIDRDYRDDE